MAAASLQILSWNNASFARIFLLLLSALTNSEAEYCFKSIIAFGDSLTDTGNLLLLSKKSDIPPVQAGLPPYGETFFHHPTGRCSDGRLVIDFLAESLGLPLIPPYIGRENISSRSNFGQGVNFAVAGATALDQSSLEKLGIYNPQTNVSLGTQLGWFKEMLSSLCQSSSDCKEFLKSSLILFGEIGGNDYNYPFLDGMPIQMIQSMVPSVINTIGQIINEVIELGAQTLVVPGNVPLGCLPAYLSHFMSSNEQDYDPRTGCINWINEFAEYHNDLLHVELKRLQQLHPHTTIVYADYYNPLMQLYLSPEKYGFRSSIVACCGGKGPYHYGSSLQCGYTSGTVCDDPSTFVSWDGVHGTEAAYYWIAKGLISGLYDNPHINEFCALQDSPVEKSDH